jgi:hypothetical protein
MLFARFCFDDVPAAQTAKDFSLKRIPSPSWRHPPTSPVAAANGPRCRRRRLMRLIP